MNLVILCGVFCLLIIGHGQAFTSDTSEFSNFLNKYKTEVTEATDFISNLTNVYPTVDTYALLDPVKDEFNLYDELYEFSEGANDESDQLNYLLKNLISTFKDAALKINAKFDSLYKELLLIDDNDVSTYILNIKFLRSSETYLSEQMECIRHSLSFGQNYFISKLSAFLQKKNHCRNFSNQRYMYYLMVYYTNLETKFLIMITAIYNKIGLLERIHFSLVLEWFKTRTKDNFVKIIKAFREATLNSSQIQQNCDLGKNHEKDKTYTFFQHLFQKVHYSRQDQVSPRFPRFRKECEKDASEKKIKCATCLYKQCAKTIDCHEGGGLEVCMNDIHEWRRYTYVQPKDEKNEDNSCSKDRNETIVRIEETCQCICEKLPESYQIERRVSLLEAQSDISQNRIITGIRLEKKNGTLQWAVKETELLLNGSLNTESKWTSTMYKKNETIKQEWENLRWSDVRRFYFDLLEVKPNTYLTGIRFVKERYPIQTSFAVQIRYTYVEENTHKLLQNKSDWSSQSHEAMSHRQLISPDVHSNAPTDVDSMHENQEIFVGNKYCIHLQPSGTFTKDAGSTAGPYFDIQPLEPKDRICGVGLDYATAPKSLGYIKPVLKLCNLL